MTQPILAGTRVAVAASRIRSEEKGIIAALEQRGFAVSVLDARRFTWSIGQAPLPWPVLVNREISLSRALYLARCAEAAGVRVINSASATQTCGDKWLTTCALVRAGVPVPRTTLALTPGAALDALDALGYPAVIKPLTGSWGRLIAEIPDRRTAQAILDYVAALPSPAAHLVYLQEKIDKPQRDIRILVAGGTVIGASYRYADGLHTNSARGGRSEPCDPSAEVAGLALRAAAAVGADIAGVDVIESGEGGPLVLEVNDRVEFAGLQAALGDGIAIGGRLVAALTGTPH